MGACCSTTQEQNANALFMPSNMLSGRSSRLKLSPSTFIPRKKIWVIVANSDYSLARQSKSLKSLHDLTEADEKVQAVLNGIKNMGANDNEIRVYENTSRKDLIQIFEQLTSEVRLEQTLAQQEGEESATLVFFYYVGHGIMQILSSALVNDKTEIRFPLERFLRTLGENRGVYVVSILDCSRYQVGGLTRQEEKIPEADTNCIISFACAPNNSKFQSRLAWDYWRKLWSFADPMNGALLLPCNEFYRWRSPGNNGEHFIQTTRDLLLIFSKPPDEGPSISAVKTLSMLSPDQVQAGGEDEGEIGQHINHEEIKQHDSRVASFNVEPQLMEEPEDNHMFKVVLVGAPKVGKTTLLRQATRSDSSEADEQFVGVESGVFRCRFEQRIVKLSLYDQTVQLQQPSRANNWLDGADCVVLVYDTGESKSFVKLSALADDALSRSSPDAFLCLYGNKNERLSRVVTASQLETFVSSRNIVNPMQVSAKVGEDVDNFFTDVARQLFQKATGIGQPKKKGILNVSSNAFLNALQKKASRHN